MTTPAAFPSEYVALGVTSSGRVFQSFHRLSLVPSRDLDRLRQSLERCISAGGTGLAHERLCLVSAELSHRQDEHRAPPG